VKRTAQGKQGGSEAELKKQIEPTQVESVKQPAPETRPSFFRRIAAKLFGK
jgi:hypothetical protein